MPYQTPSASQFTYAKRLISAISGNLSSAPGKSNVPRSVAPISIRGISPNFIRSNKFPPPEVLTIDKIIDNISLDVRTSEMASKLYDYLKQNPSKETYETVLSKLSTAIIPLSPTEDLILPEFVGDNANITPPDPLSGKTNTYILYAGSSITLPGDPDDIVITFDGTDYIYQSGADSYILNEGDALPCHPGVRFKPGSIVLDAISIPFPFPPSHAVKDEVNLVWFRDVPLDWIHPDLRTKSIDTLASFSWRTSVPLPTGLSVSNSGHIVGRIPADPSMAGTAGPSIDDISLIQTDSNGDEVEFPFTLKITPDLRLITNTFDATLNRDGYLRRDGGTTILVKLNTSVSFNVFDIDPVNPGSSIINPMDPITWAILPELPVGLTMDPITGEISGMLTRTLDADFRIGVRDQGYPWDSTRARYFTLKTVSDTIPVSSTLTVYCLTGQSKSEDLKSKIDMTQVRAPFTCGTASTLPPSISLSPDGQIIANSPSESDVGTYIIMIDVTDSYNGSRPLSAPVTVVVETQVLKTTRDAVNVVNNVNALASSGAPTTLITQGAPPITPTYVFNGGNADTTDYSLILNGTI